MRQSVYPGSGTGDIGLTGVGCGHIFGYEKKKKLNSIEEGVSQ